MITLCARHFAYSCGGYCLGDGQHHSDDVVCDSSSHVWTVWTLWPHLALSLRDSQVTVNRKASSNTVMPPSPLFLMTRWSSCVWWKDLHVVYRVFLNWHDSSCECVLMSVHLSNHPALRLSMPETLALAFSWRLSQWKSCRLCIVITFIKYYIFVLRPWSNLKGYKSVILFQ